LSRASNASSAPSKQKLNICGRNCACSKNPKAAANRTSWMVGGAPVEASVSATNSNAIAVHANFHSLSPTTPAALYTNAITTSASHS